MTELQTRMYHSLERLSLENNLIVVDSKAIHHQCDTVSQNQINQVSGCFSLIIAQIQNFAPLLPPNASPILLWQINFNSDAKSGRR